MVTNLSLKPLGPEAQLWCAHRPRTSERCYLILLGCNLSQHSFFSLQMGVKVEVLQLTYLCSLFCVFALATARHPKAQLPQTVTQLAKKALLVETYSTLFIAVLFALAFVLNVFNVSRCVDSLTGS